MAGDTLCQRGSGAGRWPLWGSLGLAILGLIWFSIRLTMPSASADPGEAVPRNTSAASSHAPAPGASDEPAPDAPEAAAALAATNPDASEATVQPISDERLRQLLVGRWKGFLHGARSLVVRDDGTATMVSEPEGMAARLIAPRLEFEINWKIEGAKLSFDTTGGKPAAKANLVLKLYGSHRTHPIIALDEQQAILANDDGSTEHWERLPAE